MATENRCSPMDEVDIREQVSMLHAMIDRLPRRYSDLIRARDFEGHDWKHIAKLFGRPSADAARMMYCKAMESLGAMIRDGSGRHSCG